jgi:hypothetical protein
MCHSIPETLFDGSRVSKAISLSLVSSAARSAPNGSARVATSSASSCNRDPMVQFGMAGGLLQVLCLQRYCAPCNNKYEEFLLILNNDR